MTIRRFVRAVACGCAVVLALAGCAASAHPASDSAPGSASVPPASGPSVATSAAVGTVVWSPVGALSLPVPDTWRLFRISPSDTLDPSAEAIVTDEPVLAGCEVSADRIEPDRCPRGGPIVRQLPGGVFAFVGVYDQPNGRVPNPTGTIDGYTAQVATDAKPFAGFCPTGATRMYTASLMAPSGTEPADVEIQACVGGSAAQAGSAVRQVAELVGGAEIAARPTATTPIPGAAPCRASSLTVTQGPIVSPATQQRVLMFAVRNTGDEPCRIVGYPTIDLLGRSGTLPFPYRHGIVTDPGPARPIYLAPGGYGFFDVATHACPLAATPVAVERIRIALPGQTQVTTLPAASRGREPGGMEFCLRRAGYGPFGVVRVGALYAY